MQSGGRLGVIGIRYGPFDVLASVHLHSDSDWRLPKAVCEPSKATNRTPGLRRHTKSEVIWRTHAATSLTTRRDGGGFQALRSIARDGGDLQSTKPAKVR